MANTILRVKFASGPSAERFEEFSIVDRTNLVSTKKIDELCDQTTQVFDLEFAEGKPYMVLQYTINNHDYKLTRYDEATPNGESREGLMPYKGQDEISLMFRDIRTGTITRQKVMDYLNGIEERIKNEATEAERAQRELEEAEEAARKKYASMG